MSDSSEEEREMGNLFDQGLRYAPHSQIISGLEHKEVRTPPIIEDNSIISFSC